MRKILLLAMAGLLVAPQAAGAETKAAANVKAVFGNTVLTIDPDGRSRKLWLKPDGTWTGLSRRGLHLAGKWKVDGDKVCMSQSQPRLLGSICQRFPTDPKVGIVTKDPLGKTIQIKLAKGHVENWPRPNRPSHRPHPRGRQAAAL